MAVTLPLTTEQEDKVWTVRIMTGDTPTSPFYPLFQDEEIAQILDMNGWRIRPAIRMAAIAASMQFAQFTYRERSGDIEVWNNISIQYQKALENLINESSTTALPDGLKPYFGGIDWQTVNKYNTDKSNVRSSLVWREIEHKNSQSRNVIYFVVDSDGNVTGG